MTVKAIVTNAGNCAGDTLRVKTGDREETLGRGESTAVDCHGHDVHIGVHGKSGDDHGVTCCGHPQVVCVEPVKRTGA